MNRAVTRVCAILSLTALLAFSSALEVTNTPRSEASGGDYATLAFHLSGEGQYNYSVDVEAPWQPLVYSGSVQLGGRGFVSVTLRVPNVAAAGHSVQVRITFTDAETGAIAAVGSGFVTPVASTSISMSAPPSLEGPTDSPLSFSILITNTGNVPDTLSLAGTSTMWNVRFDSNLVTLDPGQEQEVLISLEPEGTVSSGFRSLVELTAASLSNPSVVARRVIDVTFRDRGSGTAQSNNLNPRLTLSLGTGVTGRATLTQDGWDTGLSYSLHPGLSGDLSDYVSASADVGRFSGSIDDPFVDVPSRLWLRLAAPTWDAMTTIRNGHYTLSGSGLVGNWRIGGAGNISDNADANNYGLSAFAISQARNLDLQFAASTIWAGEHRRDNLAATYRTPIGETLLLTLGTGLTGIQTIDGYNVTLGISESLTYQGQGFDITQTYSGVPFSGIHTVGLAGGTRSAGPFGVRVSTSLQFGGSTYSWRNTLTATAAIAPGVSIGTTGTWLDSTTTTVWTVRPSLGIHYSTASLRMSFGASYAHQGVVRGNAAVSDTFSATSAINFGPISVNASASYLIRGASLDEPAGTSFEANVGAAYSHRLNTTIDTRFTYKNSTIDQAETSVFRIGWLQTWLRDISTQIGFDRNTEHSILTGRYSQTDRLSAIGQFRNVGLEGLDVSAGYALSTQHGLFTGVAPLVHNFSLRASYVWRFSFDTPNPVVDLFGGRKGGEVRGIAFMDRNLNGVFDEGEDVLPGVTVNLDGYKAVTDSDGSFRLRTREGHLQWLGTEGLPSSVSHTGAELVEVQENGVHVVNLPFAPVISVSLTLFEDTDQDGEQSPGERGIAFGGVILDGPVSRSLTVNAHGTIVVNYLVPGTYTIRPDPSRLPSRYRATTEPVQLTLTEGMDLVSIAVAAAAPPRQVQTTFTGSALAVIARVDSSSVSRGAEFEISALVTGSAERVTAEFGGHEFDLELSNGMWRASIVVPESAATGRTTIVVRAEAGGGSTTSNASINIR